MKRVFKTVTIIKKQTYTHTYFFYLLYMCLFLNDKEIKNLYFCKNNKEMIHV